MKFEILRRATDRSELIIETMNFDGDEYPSIRINHTGDDAVVVGMRASDSNDIHHVVLDAGALCDILNAILPTPRSDLTDLQAHLKTPCIPDQGDIVTVVRSPNFDGAGQPKVVIGFGSGLNFMCVPGRQPALTDYAIDAKVILDCKDHDSGVATQYVPVWVIRAYVDPAAQPTAA